MSCSMFIIICIYYIGRTNTYILGCIKCASVLISCLKMFYGSKRNSHFSRLHLPMKLGHWKEKNIFKLLRKSVHIFLLVLIMSQNCLLYIIRIGLYLCSRSTEIIQGTSVYRVFVNFQCLMMTNKFLEIYSTHSTHFCFLIFTSFAWWTT